MENRFKFKIDDILIDKNGEIVQVVDINIDHHTHVLDYRIKVVKGNRHSTGMQFWVHKSTVESWYTLAKESANILFGDVK